MSLARALRRMTAGSSVVGAGASLRKTLAAVLLLGATTLGCHVFSPGLSTQRSSQRVSPDGSSPGPDSSLSEDALLTEPQGPVSGLAVKVGCSDGTREGFRNLEQWPDIAGCAGGWQKLGLPVSGNPPRPCGRMAGDSSSNPEGLQCSALSDACVECGVADLCAPFWHPCIDGREVMNLSPTGCEDILPPGEQGFFVAMVGASADGVCAPGERNDLHGCGNLGLPESDRCPPFSRRMGFADCENTGGIWKCGSSSQNLDEADLVIKPRPDQGGVLCCKD